MAFSNLEKALLLKLGIDVARNPVSRAAVKTAVTMVGRQAVAPTARKAFTQVTKVASKLNKGQKVSPKGPTGIIKRAINKFFPKKKPVRRTNGKVSYSITVNK